MDNIIKELGEFIIDFSKVYGHSLSSEITEEERDYLLDNIPEIINRSKQFKSTERVIKELNIVRFTVTCECNKSGVNIRARLIDNNNEYIESCIHLSLIF